MANMPILFPAPPNVIGGSFGWRGQTSRVNYWGEGSVLSQSCLMACYYLMYFAGVFCGRILWAYFMGVFSLFFHTFPFIPLPHSLPPTSWWLFGPIGRLNCSLWRRRQLAVKWRWGILRRIFFWYDMYDTRPLVWCSILILNDWGISMFIWWLASVLRHMHGLLVCC